MNTKKVNDDGDDDGEEIIKLQEQFDKARVALDVSQKQMFTLHKAWRAQLHELVYGTGIDWNKNFNVIGFWDSVYYCFSDSMMEIMQILCCLSLIWLMYQPMDGNDFSSLPFRTAIGFIPLILSSYYNNPTLGCLKNLLLDDDNSSATTETIAETLPRPFPVMLIFLGVGISSLFFMSYQQNQQEENIEKINKFRENLIGNKKKK
ncbi:hypothetical protein FRACYDRAFT_249165 [Fragilariopsis cylindrus CCMP1102]|uniref:Uncharacterized protein n=1 Tax=Fragilariopsis cylindrus CCMP1102 TaxID=635003 RepID=A0A1E7ETD6_9STRA|nr:hypothetical protein FRACYDRAFT_249165 [Fragilariopsis cylindrus CCMP1102]|eukprot:OEU08823.1 hypothetical protein FRACYDRAFT_249165 [Fragilariopsis cylindrus CCMP1102]